MRDLIAEYRETRNRLFSIARQLEGKQVKSIRTSEEESVHYTVICVRCNFGVELEVLEKGVIDKNASIPTSVDAVEIVDDSKGPLFGTVEIEIKAAPSDEDTRIIKKPASDLIIEPADDFERLQIAVSNVERIRDEIANLAAKGLKEGSRVYHDKHGWGTVQSSGLLVYVKFDKCETEQVVCLYELSTARGPLDLNRGLVAFANDPQTPIADTPIIVTADTRTEEVQQQDSEYPF